MTDTNPAMTSLRVGDRASISKEYEVRRHYRGGVHSTYVLPTLAAARDKRRRILATLPDAAVTIHERQVTTTEGPWKLVVES